ncbi:MAG TPA: hypothetical protein PLN06_00805 [Bacteroidales bacterium]|nr:hypothetical protein [Bacteroidales bacterium]HOU95150.1 hypothetical protein [Bacteroidales bacterium]HQG37120.1 hypothetical protein [Bacteroidales bacterium]HQG53678.1 hypothetical protein [Bacteroidales bacterium]HQJ21291.1 hypothetical protein [Bacteroidales bacterium]
MKKQRLLALFSILIILAFIVYIIYDTARKPAEFKENAVEAEKTSPPEQWKVLQEVFVAQGLKAVAVSPEGNIFLGGDSFLSCYDKDLKEIWTQSTPDKITAITVSGDTVFATSEELIFLVNTGGKPIGEWGPYDENSLFTSISANKNYLAVADAGNKIVYIMKKDGEVISIIGHSGEKLLIPSPYFDVFLTPDNTLFLAHTGNFRIEKRSIEGQFQSTFGKSGTAPEDFCGCCNPAHFTVIPQGFVTSEKGMNRIKIMGPEGGFFEYVSSNNNFVASVPLDVASIDGNIIYGANPADGKLYVFIRK